MTKNIDAKVVVFFVTVLFLLALFALISMNVVQTFATTEIGDFVGACAATCTTTG